MIGAPRTGEFHATALLSRHVAHLLSEFDSIELGTVGRRCERGASEARVNRLMPRRIGERPGIQVEPIGRDDRADPDLLLVEQLCERRCQPTPGGVRIGGNRNLETMIRGVVRKTSSNRLVGGLSTKQCDRSKAGLARRERVRQAFAHQQCLAALASRDGVSEARVRGDRS